MLSAMPKSFGFLIGVMLLLLGCTGSLSRPGAPPYGAKPPSDQMPAPPPPGPSKPTDPVDEPEVFKWSHLESKGSAEEIPDVPICPEPFRIGLACEGPTLRCHRNLNIYACAPENHLYRISGKIVDTNGNAVAGALVYAGLPLSGYSQMIETRASADGRFLLKGECFPLLFAQMDGYSSISDYYVVSQLSNCVSKDYQGAKNQVLTLKKISRSVALDREPAPGDGCSVVGRVLDEKGRGLFEVSVLAGEQEVKTDEDGYYSIRARACPQTCEARMQGYSPASGQRALVSCLVGRPADLLLKKNQ